MKRRYRAGLRRLGRANDGSRVKPPNCSPDFCNKICQAPDIQLTSRRSYFDKYPLMGLKRRPGGVPMSNLKGKIAVVTGASKGIGAAIAKRLSEAGAAVVVNYSSNKEDADRVVSDIKANGGE